MSDFEREENEEIIEEDEIEIEATPAEPPEPPKIKTLLSELLEQAKSEVEQEKLKLEEEFRRKEEEERRRKEEEEARKREEYRKKVNEERRKREEQIKAHEERLRQKALEEQIRREIEAEEKKEQSSRKKKPAYIYPAAVLIAIALVTGIYSMTRSDLQPVTFGMGELKEEGVNSELSPDPLPNSTLREIDKQMMIPPDVLIVNVDPQKIAYHKAGENKKGKYKGAAKTEGVKGVQIKVKTGIFDTKKVIK